MIRSVVFLSLLGTGAAFQSLTVPRQSQTALAVSYLDSLQGPVQSNEITAPPSIISVNDDDSPAVEAASVEAPAAEAAPTKISFAPLNYFDLDKLTSKGPRDTKDWGTPQDATRMLADDGTFRAGAWWCSEGGWPSPNPKAHTEVFYVLTGHGCLGDADGAKHYFGPGDTVTIPKGHTGRWDVYGPIHKIWAVNAHEKVEETANPIRAEVVHYHSFGPHWLTSNTNTGSDPLYGMTTSSAESRTFYDVGPTKVGVWTCEPGSIAVSRGPRSFFFVLEGVVFVTDGSDGSARRCAAGDTVVLPEGWHGHIDVLERAKKVWVTAD